MTKIQVIDYGMGNIGSVLNIINHVGGEVAVCSTPTDLVKHGKIILPGVGHFGKAMTLLQDDGWICALEQARGRGVWIMGICLGMQLMTRYSEEACCGGLDWFDLQTIRFPVTADGNKPLTVPHMGWNTASFCQRGRFEEFGNVGRFYFVHSYYVDAAGDSDCWATTEYGGVRFASGIRKDRLIGVQFHPEKSHRCGMRFMRNFVDIA